MGHGAMIRLKWVQRFTDKETGNTYYYFRKPRTKRVRLPGAPGTDEFMAAYQGAMRVPHFDIGEKRTKPGSVSAAIIAYYHAAFPRLSPASRTTYRGIAERFRKEHGDKQIATLTKQHIEHMLFKLANKPGAAVNFLKVLRGMMKVAVKLGFREDNPCHSITIESSRTAKVGFREWGEDEIAKFEAKHPIGTRARLALALLLYTGQRRGDVVRMGRQHESKSFLKVVQQKTKVELSIPIHPELRKIIDATTTSNMTYLLTQYDEPFTVAGFSNWFRDMCEEAGIFGFPAHGLRKSACRRLANAGCSVHQIMSISGHKTMKEVERYTRGYDQERSAVLAMQKVTAGIN
jgi:integrase